MIELSREDTKKIEKIVRLLWAGGVYPRDIREVLYDAIDEALEDMRDEEIALWKEDYGD